LDRERVQELLKDAPKSVSIWQAIAKQDFTVPKASVLVRYFKTGELDDALAAIFDDPAWLEPISKSLKEKTFVLLDLATCYVLCAEDSPSNLPLISALIVCILVERAHPVLVSLTEGERVRLAWLEFCDREPEVARKIIRRLEKVASLLELDDTMQILLDYS
jgi:hypothetical protein